MGRDYKLISKNSKGEVIFDEGFYTFVPKGYTPYQYKKFKSLKMLIRKNKL